MQFFIVATTAMAMVMGASAAAVPKVSARQIAIDFKVIGQGFASTSTATEELGVSHAPNDSIQFHFGQLDAAEITLPGTTCSFTAARAGNDAEHNVACDLATKLKDVSFGDGKVYLGGNAECAFCVTSP